MGRPSLSDVRREEILDAFERCVARYGLAGTSLQRVADEAGMQRSILRHYIGNRDELIEALADRVVTKYREQFRQFLDSLPSRGAANRLLAFLFPDRPVESAAGILVVESLIAAAEDHPRVRNLLVQYLEELVRQTAAVLRTSFPEASRQRCWNVAYGLIGLWFNQESLAPLALPPKFVKAARASATALIESLQR